MKAIVLNESGGVRNLDLTTLPKPIIKDNEVLVRVAAISVNPVDFKTRKSNQMIQNFYGASRPVVLGWDISGVVEASNSEQFKIGDEVFGMINFPGNGSAYAEYVSVSAKHITHKPKSVSHEEAAAATLAALTAWQVLVNNGNLSKGKRLLVNGASGGVGHYAIQIGKAMGAYVIGTSSGKNKNFVLENGANLHIDYQQQNSLNEVLDVDLVLDTIGGDNILNLIEVTKKGGKVFCITNGNFSQEYIDEAAKRNISLLFILVKSSGSDMQIIADMLENGKLKSHISKTFPLEELQKSHEALETGRTVGKIVVTL
jgi:NADPH:quinone reductase-like Zn-dependent oxidoreductase